MKKFRMALAGALVAACIAGMVSPAFADPEAVAKAKADLERIHQEASAIDQEIIEASVRADDSKAKLVSITADLNVQKSKVAKLADELGGIAVVQFQSGGFDVTAQLLTSDSDSSFLSSLATIANEADRSNAGLQTLQVEQATLDSLQGQADRTNASLQADLASKQELAKQFDAKEAEAEQVYNRLSEEEKQRLRALEIERERKQAEADRRAAAQAAAERAARATRSQETRPSASASTPAGTAPATAPADETPAPEPSSGASDRAQRAVEIALAQVGERYVWGTSGPNTFDCSGLTSYAYRQVGITISRSSRAQLSVGYKVSKSELKPGDLVFYYSPVSHVGMYIGNGKIVDAANPRKGVRVTSLNSMPFATARRVVG